MTDYTEELKQIAINLNTPDETTVTGAIEDLTAVVASLDDENKKTGIEICRQLIDLNRAMDAIAYQLKRIADQGAK